MPPTNSASGETVLATLGGTVGMAETALPAVVFAMAYPIAGTTIAAVSALAIAAVFGAVRLARRATPRHALAGVAGVALAAFVATRSGRAEDFFLPGLLLNAVYATAFAVSVAARRPLIGYVVALAGAGGRAWPREARRSAAVTQASLMWAVLFSARLVVQVPLYLGGAVVALGLARAAMGVPLFALGVWITYRLVDETDVRIASRSESQE